MWLKKNCSIIKRSEAKVGKGISWLRRGKKFFFKVGTLKSTEKGLEITETESEGEKMSKL